MNDLPVFPDVAELAALWPMWLALAGFFVTWLFSSHMDRRTRRWYRMKLAQEAKLQTPSYHVDS